VSLPSDHVRERAEAVLRFRIETWTVVRRGYTPTARYLVRGGGQSAFLKIGTTPLSARMVNREIAVYQRVAAPFMPCFLEADLDEAEPILAIEDLSGADWPPPWTSDRVDLVLDAIASMHDIVAPLDPHPFLHEGREAGWPLVAEDPEPFLALDLVSRDWLERALPALIEAEARCVLHGDRLTHLDLRSDNICIHEGRVKLVDWAEAGGGNPQVDLGFFLPSLAFESGPMPEAVLPDAPEIAALISGFFAARAGLPIIPEAPLVRQVQREQLSTALPWVQRALGL